MTILNKILLIISIIPLFFFLSCEKPEREAKVETGQVTDITATSAKVAGEIIDVGEGITEHGHCWGFGSKPTISDLKTTLGLTDVTGNFTSELFNLEAGKLYHVQAYAMSGNDVVYGKSQKFITQDGSAQVITAEITDTTINSAKSGGNILSVNGDEVIARGVCWDTVDIFTLDDCMGFTIDSAGMGKYISEITGLTPGDLYYIKAYAITSVDTSYGIIVIFTTLNGIASLSTTAITNITINSATSGGNITDDGGAAIIARGVCWNTTGNPTTGDNKTTDGSGKGSYTSQLTGLELNTTYYVRAYSINYVDTTYGQQITFKTHNGILTITTTSANIITANSVISGGDITNDGGAAITARGVCWNTKGNPTLESNDGHTIDGSGTGSFTSSLTGLTGNTTYYVRAYATNSVGTAYGNELPFKTSAVVSTITTTAVTLITATTANSGGNITNDGGASVTARGVCWSASPDPTIASSKTTDGSGTGTFTSSITGLTPGTTYYVRAYATNSSGTGYGAEKSFGTLIIPTVTTSDISSITSVDATGGGEVTFNGNTSVTARGVCWSISQNPTISDSKTTDGVGIGTFTSKFTNLTPNTTYYVRAYATNSEGTAYGEQKSFTTGIALPTVTTASITTITATTANSVGNIIDDGGASVTARGICWSTSQNPTVADSHTNDGNGTGSFTSSLTGLTGNTTYYVRTYATNSAGTAYGNEVSFTTSPVVPSLTTTAVTSITATTASSGGNITDDGGASVTARGLCWSTSHDPTVTDTHTNDGSGTGSFTSSLTGLIGNTTYYVRAYAINSVGTAYGANELSFKTNAVIPILTTTVVTSITVTTASSGGNITDNGGASVTARGVCWSTSQNPTIADAYTNDGSGTGSFTSSLTGLTGNTTYYVRAYATNNMGTAYGNQVSFTTFLCPNTLTVTHTAGNVTPVTKIVTYGIVETNLSGENKCWITQNLGADNQAGSFYDNTEAAAGWYWQFNRKQGYKHDGSTRTPSTTWISSIDEESDWTAANDPCTILLGTGWRIPTQMEWITADNNGGWSNYNDTYASVLKLHIAGFLDESNGSLWNRGASGHYWSSVQSSNTYGWGLHFHSYKSDMFSFSKARGLSVRCLRD